MSECVFVWLTYLLINQRKYNIKKGKKNISQNPWYAICLQKELMFRIKMYFKR